MVKELLTKKQGSFSIVDAFGVAVSKSLVVDKLAMPLIQKVTKGNGLFDVGGLFVGAIASQKIPKVGGIIATSMMVSAGDRIVNAIFPSKKSTPVTTGQSDDFGSSNKVTVREEFI